MWSSPPAPLPSRPIDKCGTPRRSRVAEITFHAGINEIGGNKMLLEDRGTRVFIDFGMQMGRYGLYFAEFAKPRGFAGMDDLLGTGLLPRMRGIYRKDYARHSGYRWKAGARGDHAEDTSIDGVLLSHAHVDHCAYIRYLRPDIPVYCSRESELIMRCFEETGGSDQYITYKENYKTYKKKDGSYGRAASAGNREEARRDIRVVKPGRLRIDSIEVEAVPIDHSLPGVYGFVIHTSGGSVGYTADIRYHGRRGRDTEAFVERCRGAGLDWLLCEGTRIDAFRPSRTELDMEKEIARRIEKARGLVVCTYPTRDLDRFLSFYNAARQAGRTLAIDTKQAYLLKLFRDAGIRAYPGPGDAHLAVCVERKSWGLLDRKGYDRGLADADYGLWERQFLDFDNRVSHAGVGRRQKEHVLYCSDFKLMHLADVRPRNGSYIRSSTEPFDEEMSLDRERVRRWLVHFKLLGEREEMEHVHVSGHGTADQITRVLQESEARSVTPIHTERPEIFRLLHGNVRMAEPGGTLAVA